MSRRSLGDSLKAINELVGGLIAAGLGVRDLAVLRRHPELYDEVVARIREVHSFKWQPVGLPETLRLKQLRALLEGHVGKISDGDLQHYAQSNNFFRLVYGLDEAHRTALYLRSGIHSGVPRAEQDIAASWLPFTTAQVRRMLQHAHQYLQDAYERERRLRALAADDESPQERFIDELPITERTRNCLKRLRVYTVSELCERTAEELLADLPFGELQLQEVIMTLEAFELKLRQAD